MNKIVSKYVGILSLSLFALCPQGVMAQEAAETDTINVAFRQSDVRDVIVPVSSAPLACAVFPARISPTAAVSSDVSES